MSTDNFIDVAKVFGKGKIQVPKAVRNLLRLEDGDRVYFKQDLEGNILLEKAPELKKEGFGKYDKVKKGV